jgi:hypothetical protein
MRIPDPELLGVVVYKEGSAKGFDLVSWPKTSLPKVRG